MSGGGGSSSSQPTNQTVTQTNLPAYAQPYFEDIMGRAQAASNQQYTPYTGQRIADLTPAQQGVDQNVLGMGQNYGFTSGQNLNATAGLQALQLGNYQPKSFNAQTVAAPGGVANVNPYTAGGVQNVQSQNIAGAGNIDASKFAVDPSSAAQMQGAQSSYNPNLQTFQMGPAGTFGQQQVDQYTSPYFQNVVDVQKAAALRDAQKAQLTQNLGAARQGTYGGARQLLATTERERNLGDQMAQIQATGSQSAYENAQQQYERDRQAGLGVASQNLQAQLGVQQLGTQTGLQVAMSNLSNQQQAAVQNQAAQLQMQGMNAQQALQAALANQQTQQGTQQFNAQSGLQAALANQQSGLTTQGLNSQNYMQAMLANQQSGLTTQGQGLQAALANQQANLSAQQQAEQSRQFGSNLGLQGLQLASQAGNSAVQNASATQAADLARYQAQAAVGTQQQQQQQQLLDQQYADFLRQRDYPMEQLGYYSNILHGVPVGLNSTSTSYATPPSMASQLGGAGLSALSLYNLAK
jgi:hypothetical protein